MLVAGSKAGSSVSPLNDSTLTTIGVDGEVDQLLITWMALLFNASLLTNRRSLPASYSIPVGSSIPAGPNSLTVCNGGVT